jgi:prepilin-type N-terminal cleavage/methylation domain-containing protein
MKLNRKNKKGFTIVELVIVIGVIGILSAILIPTFANLTTKAQESAKKEELQNAYTAYIMDSADDTPFQALALNKVALVKKDVAGKYYTYGDKAWDPAEKTGALNTNYKEVDTHDYTNGYNGYFVYELVSA